MMLVTKTQIPIVILLDFESKTFADLATPTYFFQPVEKGVLFSHKWISQNY